MINMLLYYHKQLSLAHDFVRQKPLYNEDLKFSLVAFL